MQHSALARQVRLSVRLRRIRRSLELSSSRKTTSLTMRCMVGGDAMRWFNRITIVHWPPEHPCDGETIPEKLRRAKKRFSDVGSRLDSYCCVEPCSVVAVSSELAWQRAPKSSCSLLKMELPSFGRKKRKRILGVQGAQWEYASEKFVCENPLRISCGNSFKSYCVHRFLQWRFYSPTNVSSLVLFGLASEVFQEEI